jgi:excinuclease UvrABC nuclease subunit
LKNRSIDEVRNFLKTAATIKFIDTETEDDAKILEDVLVAIHHPYTIKEIKETNGYSLKFSLSFYQELLKLIIVYCFELSK